VSRLFQEKKLKDTPPYEPCKLPIEVNTNSTWDPVVVAREAEVESLFDKFVKKMEFTIPTDPNALTVANPVFDPLFCMLCLQRSLLHGFSKRMKDHLAKVPGSEAAPDSSTQDVTAPAADMGDRPSAPYSQWNSSSGVPPQQHQQQVWADEFRNNPMIAFMNSTQFNSINFDTILPPDSLPMAAPSHHDYLWDTVMDDFTFPI
jgi:hypothetical protein